MRSRSTGHRFFDVDASHVQVGELLAHRSEAYKNSIHCNRKLFLILCEARGLRQGSWYFRYFTRSG